MKASEGTGAAVGLPVPASVPRPWKTSPLTEGRMLGRKHGVVQPGEPKVLTSASCCEGPSGRLRGPWDGTGLPKHTEKADGDVAAVSGGTRDHGWKGKPPCGSCVHQHPAGLRSAHGLRSSPYSVHFMGCKTIWGSVWLVQAAWAHMSWTKPETVQGALRSRSTIHRHPMSTALIRIWPLVAPAAGL